MSTINSVRTLRRRAAACATFEWSYDGKAWAPCLNVNHAVILLRDGYLIRERKSSNNEGDAP